MKRSVGNLHESHLTGPQAGRQQTINFWQQQDKTALKIKRVRLQKWNERNKAYFEQAQE